MAHSALKFLVLYFAFSASALVFAAPAHQHPTERHLGGVAFQKDDLLPHPRAPERIAAVDGQSSPEENTAVAKRVTNAERIANGLPPLSPRRLYDGSRAVSAHNARSSPVPPIPVPAILVYGPDGRTGSPLGYVSRSYTSKMYYFTTDCNEAMVDAELFAGDLTNPAEPGGYRNVGLIPGWPVDTFRSNDPMFGLLVGTAATPSGPPQLSKSQSAISSSWYMESKVWSLGPDNELLLTWTNPNGDVIPMEITYIAFYDNHISTTANLSVSRSTFGDSEEDLPKIRLFIADQFTCRSATQAV